MRSKYAAPETPTFAELTFAYDRAVYTVRRSPEYRRPKTRGEGMTTQHAMAELTCPDGRVITKQTDVDDEITALLGLDHDQFCQIAMLAQRGLFCVCCLPRQRIAAVSSKSCLTPGGMPACRRSCDSLLWR